MTCAVSNAAFKKLLTAIGVSIIGYAGGPLPSFDVNR